MLKLPISAVKLNDENPRTLKDVRFQQLIKSIQDFPQMLDLRPCVVDENHVVLGGNMRLRAMQHLGFTEVNVTVAKGLTEAQKKEFVIKDNGSYGDWDFNMLANGDWPDAATLNDWGMELPTAWADIEPEILDEIGLPDGDKPGFKQMTFTLSDLQAQDIETALRLAKAENDFEGTGNENSNGNALAAVIAEYNSARNGD